MTPSLRGFLDAGMRVAFSSYLRNQNRIVYGDDDTFLSGLPSELAGGLRNFLAVSDMSDDDYFDFFEETHRRYNAHPSGKVRVLVSPANVQWASDDFLQRA